MMDYLYRTTDLKLFIIISLFFLAVSIFSLFITRWLMPLPLRYQENVVIGCTSALVIGIYGILAGFATLYLINNNNNASDAVMHESNAIANLYHYSQGLNDTARPQVQQDIKKYLQQIVHVEWPLMSVGKPIPDDGDTILNNIVGELTHYKAENLTEPPLLSNMLLVSREVYDAREQRIQMSYASLSVEIWVVIVIGTILTLGISYLFGVNFYLHLFIVLAAVLMTSSIIFLLISLDKPYQGDYVIGPEMFISLLHTVEKA